MFLSPFFFTAQKFLPTDFSGRQDYFFARALKKAQFASGSTYPNPSVGAVLTKNDEIIGEGFTHRAGGMHAEKHAIAQASSNVRDGTLFVTLEPCCHFGRTPPCTDAIIDAGIKCVIFGAVDKNPTVENKGVDALRRAGIRVDHIANNDLLAKAVQHIRPFTTWVKESRPYVVAKIASSFDQKIGLINKRTKITDEQSDVMVHQLRRAVDAVMVGKNTVCIDNPMLTARLGEKNHNQQPIRVVLTRDLSIHDDAHIFDQSAKTIVITTRERDQRKEESLLARGVEVIICDVEHEKINLISALLMLAHRGITSLLVEPGQKLFFSLMKKRLPDEVWWFRSKIILGEGGLYVPIEQTLASEGYALHHRQSQGADELFVFLRN